MSTASEEKKKKSAWSIWMTELPTGAVLICLLSISFGSAYIPLGDYNALVNLGIAAIKATLVGIIFMELRTSGPLFRLVAMVGLIFILIMFVLTFTDIYMRWPRV